MKGLNNIEIMKKLHERLNYPQNEANNYTMELKKKTYLAKSELMLLAKINKLCWFLVYFYH